MSDKVKMYTMLHSQYHAESENMHANSIDIPPFLLLPPKVKSKKKFWRFRPFSSHKCFVMIFWDQIYYIIWKNRIFPFQRGFTFVPKVYGRKCMIFFLIICKFGRFCKFFGRLLMENYFFGFFFLGSSSMHKNASNKVWPSKI